MKKFAILICGFVAACNYDTGECYPRDQGGAGVGGGVIVPGGVGGLGDVPPAVQTLWCQFPPGAHGGQVKEPRQRPSPPCTRNWTLR